MVDYFKNLLFILKCASFLSACTNGFFLDGAANGYSCRGYLLSCPLLCQSVDIDGCIKCGECASSDPSNPAGGSDPFRQAMSVSGSDPSRPSTFSKSDPSRPDVSTAGSDPFRPAASASNSDPSRPGTYTSGSDPSRPEVPVSSSDPSRPSASVSGGELFRPEIATSSGNSSRQGTSISGDLSNPFAAQRSSPDGQECEKWTVCTCPVYLEPTTGCPICTCSTETSTSVPTTVESDVGTKMTASFTSMTSP